MSDQQEKMAASVLAIQAVLSSLMSELIACGALPQDGVRLVIQRAIDLTHVSDDPAATLAEKNLLNAFGHVLKREKE